VADGYVAGSYTFDSDDISGVHTPRVKLVWGAGGAKNDASALAPIPVTLAPIATGGATPNMSIDVDETEDEIKSSAGTLYSLFIYNRATAKRYVRLYDAPAASCTVGTTPAVAVYCLEADQGMTIAFPHGMKFSSGICIAATTSFEANNTGAPGANEVIASWTFV
jgi:hypothetical protein